jgi:hypothetical protein
MTATAVTPVTSSASAGKTTRAAQIARFRRDADSQADERLAVQNGGDARVRPGQRRSRSVE